MTKKEEKEEKMKMKLGQWRKINKTEKEIEKRE